MIAPARRAAYDVTRRVDAQDVDLARALADARDALPSARDRALATDIAIGTQRWRRTLDHLLERVSGRPVERLDAEVLAILRLSAYQLRHLTRVPASAVVNDAVALTKTARKRSATGFVNAVLRKLATAAPPLPGLPTVPSADPAWRAQALAYLGVTQSHPDWLVERWLDRYGWDATLAWVRHDNAPATVTLWPTSPEAVPRAAGRHPAAPSPWPAHTPTAWLPGGLVLEEASEAVAVLEGGQAFAQDEASAIVGAVAAAAARTPVYDACAAPGGKTLVLAMTLAPAVQVVAGDLRSGRVATLRDLLARYARRPIPVLRADATALPFGGTLGTVLLDAPCSSLGTVRRDPDIRWRRSPGDVARFARIQRAMAEEAMRAVGPAGRVVYATCSSEPEENEALVSALTRDGGWRIVPAQQLALPGRVPALVAPDGWIRTLPHVHGLDAFFVAVLEADGRIKS